MKKTLKTMLIIALFTCLIITFTGCGKNDDEEVRVKEKAEEAIEKTEEVLDKVGEVEKVEENVVAKEFSMGEWNNNIYSNDFLGLKFSLPKGWSYSSEKEIADMMNLGKDLLNDDQKLAAEVSKLNSAYYLVANNPNTGDNVTILSEKPIVDITTDYYINQLKTQLLAVQSISYEIEGTSKENVAGKEYDVLTVTGTMSGIEVSQKYYIYKVDNYIVCIIATSNRGEAEINNIMKSFK